MPTANLRQEKFWDQQEMTEDIERRGKEREQKVRLEGLVPKDPG